MPCQNIWQLRWNDKFIKRHKLLKLTQEKIDNLDSSISIINIKNVANNLSTMKCLKPDGFTGKFNQTFKIEVNTNSI